MFALLVIQAIQCASFQMCIKCEKNIIPDKATHAAPVLVHVLPFRCSLPVMMAQTIAAVAEIVSVAQVRDNTS